jgi:hypothetical protein
MEHLIHSVEKLIEVVLSAGSSKSGEEMHGEKIIKSIVSKWPVEEMCVGLEYDSAVLLSESSAIVRFMTREQLVGLVKGLMGPSRVKREKVSGYIVDDVSKVDTENEGSTSDKFLTTVPEVSEDAVLDQSLEDSLVDAWSKELLTCATKMRKIDNKTFRLDLSFWNQISDERKQSMMVNMKKSFPKVSLYHMKVCMLSAALKLGCDVQPHEFSNIGVTICKQHPIILDCDDSAAKSAQSLSCLSEFSNSSEASTGTILVDGIREEISKMSSEDIEYGDLVILVAHNDIREAEKGPVGVSMTIKGNGKQKNQVYQMSHGFQVVALGVYQGDMIGLPTANGAVKENTCAVFLRDTFPCAHLRTFFRVYNNGELLSTFSSQKLHQQHRIR